MGVVWMLLCRQRHQQIAAKFDGNKADKEQGPPLASADISTQ